MTTRNQKTQLTALQNPQTPDPVSLFEHTSARPLGAGRHVADFPLPVDAIRVLSLPERRDRRAQVCTELARLGVRSDDPRLRVVDGVRPAEAAGFPSIGARGCFLGHLRLLRDLQACGCQRALVLEDDALPLGEPAAFWTLLAALPTELALAYPGHVEPAVPGPLRWIDCTPTQGLACTHAYVVDAGVLPALIAWLEACLTRAPGAPEGGPMHVDGAFSAFRARHPALRTLRASQSRVAQRSSASDVAAPTWAQAHLPRMLLDPLRALRNRWRRRE